VTTPPRTRLSRNGSGMDGRIGDTWQMGSAATSIGSNDPTNDNYNSEPLAQSSVGPARSPLLADQRLPRGHANSSWRYNPQGGESDSQAESIHTTSSGNMATPGSRSAISRSRTSSWRSGSRARTRLPAIAGLVMGRRSTADIVACSCASRRKRSWQLRTNRHRRCSSV